MIFLKNPAISDFLFAIFWWNYFNLSNIFSINNNPSIGIQIVNREKFKGFHESIARHKHPHGQAMRTHVLIVRHEYAPK